MENSEIVSKPLSFFGIDKQYITRKTNTSFRFIVDKKVNKKKSHAMQLYTGRLRVLPDFGTTTCQREVELCVGKFRILSLISSRKYACSLALWWGEWKLSALPRPVFLAPIPCSLSRLLYAADLPPTPTDNLTNQKPIQKPRFTPAPTLFYFRPSSISSLAPAVCQALLTSLQISLTPKGGLPYSISHTP